jgi:hypothetical protein
LSGYRSRDRRCCRLGYREKNDEFGAFANSAADFDLPAVIGDDPVDDREPEPGAFANLFGRKEWLEDPILRFGIHAAAGIGDAKANEIAAAEAI